MSPLRYLMMSALLIITASPGRNGNLFSQEKQSREVVEAYRVCHRFQTLLAESLDFDRAYEATFTKNMSRRREIAISDGEFGNLDLTSVDDVTLISAYKSRMQIFYLMLPLASPDNNEQETLFFPPDIKKIFQRKPPRATEEFHSFAAQLERDVRQFRQHLERLAKQYPAVADRVRKFKTEELSEKFEPPNQVVQPLYAYSRGRVLSKDEPYYSINGYTVIREDGQMRIVGIRFFTRLF